MLPDIALLCIPVQGKQYPEQVTKQMTGESQGSMEFGPSDFPHTQLKISHWSVNKSPDYCTSFIGIPISAPKPDERFTNLWPVLGPGGS